MSASRCPNRSIPVTRPGRPYLELKLKFHHVEGRSMVRQSYDVVLQGQCVHFIAGWSFSYLCQLSTRCEPSGTLKVHCLVVLAPNISVNLDDHSKIIPIRLDSKTPTRNMLKPPTRSHHRPSPAISPISVRSRRMCRKPGPEIEMRYGISCIVCIVYICKLHVAS